MKDDIADLPSPYLPHPKFGLLHLPRFIAKIRLHLKGELPEGYRRNFTRGFDGFLCLHLGVSPEDVIEIVRRAQSDEEITRGLEAIFPQDVKPHVWNRRLVQIGMSDEGRAALRKSRESMGVPDRMDLKSFADMIEYDEGRVE